MKIYIIGSITCLPTIEKVYATYKELGFDVRKVNNDDCLLQESILNCYKNIDWCDTLIVVTKNNGDIGNGVLYEIMYAKHTNTNYVFYTKDNN